ncbi:MAG TPA: hypothetical protein VK070_04350 [Acidimicrobiia bacterium]|jgi:hypothetical protein|nr:hypothetical protein [Acidimicrobiia bacterium]
MLNNPAFSALAVIGAAGAISGLLGGVAAGARRLIGTILMGVIGAIAAAAIARAAGAPIIYGIGGFSYVYGAAGGLLLSYVVGRNDRP